MEKQSINALLKKYFGFDSFKSGQYEIIEQILKGTDVLAVMPTGSGKSICYQIPALAFKGVAIVVSPLISLMKDQIDVLLKNGVEAAFINSSLNLQEYNRVWQNAKRGQYKLIYIAPERLCNEGFLELVSNLKVSLVAVDEAHCISQWGHDFRPSYMEISKLIEKLPVRPVIAAFTATATLPVKDDIINHLKLNHPFTLTLGFDRENLYFEVLKPADKYAKLIDYLGREGSKPGIVYAATRKTVATKMKKTRLIKSSTRLYRIAIPTGAFAHSFLPISVKRKKLAATAATAKTVLNRRMLR